MQHHVDIFARFWIETPALRYAVLQLTIKENRAPFSLEFGEDLPMPDQNSYLRLPLQLFSSTHSCNESKTARTFRNYIRKYVFMARKHFNFNFIHFARSLNCYCPCFFQSSSITACIHFLIETADTVCTAQTLVHGFVSVGTLFALTRANFYVIVYWAMLPYCNCSAKT